MGTRAPHPPCHGPPRLLSTREQPAHGESLKTQGWGVAGNKLICTDVLGGRTGGRDSHRWAVPPERGGVSTGRRGPMNNMRAQIKPQNNARSQVMENGREMGRYPGSHRARLREQSPAEQGEGGDPSTPRGCAGASRGGPRFAGRPPGLAPVPRAAHEPGDPEAELLPASGRDAEPRTEAARQLPPPA